VAGFNGWGKGGDIITSSVLDIEGKEQRATGRKESGRHQSPFFQLALTRPLSALMVGGGGVRLPGSRFSRLASCLSMFSLSLVRRAGACFWGAANGRAHKV
jgi:hypothetical protein